MSGPILTPNDVLAKLLKPGAKTSEFCSLIAVWAGALATLLGLFNTSNPTVNGDLKIAALVVAAIAHASYAMSRGQVKKALVAVQAGLSAAKAPVEISTGPVSVTGDLDVAGKARGDAGFVSASLLGGLLILAGVVVAILAGKLVVILLGVAVAVIGLVLLLTASNVRVVR